MLRVDRTLGTLGLMPHRTREPVVRLLHRREAEHAVRGAAISLCTAILRSAGTTVCGERGVDNSRGIVRAGCGVHKPRCRQGSRHKGTQRNTEQVSAFCGHCCSVRGPIHTPHMPRCTTCMCTPSLVAAPVLGLGSPRDVYRQSIKYMYKLKSIIFHTCILIS